MADAANAILLAARSRMAGRFLLASWRLTRMPGLGRLLAVSVEQGLSDWAAIRRLKPAWDVAS